MPSLPFNEEHKAALLATRADGISACIAMVVTRSDWSMNLTAYIVACKCVGGSGFTHTHQIGPDARLLQSMLATVHAQ